VRAIADQLQGWIYLPSGEHIARSLRDAEIWAEFNGRNGRELAQKYHRHPEHIAKILREQRKLEKWRRRGGDGGR
jgi:Mor family transcriptional regulator